MSLVCMVMYGIFDYLIAGPARKIQASHLIVIFSWMNALIFWLLLPLFWANIDFSFSVIYPILAGITGHLWVFFYSKSVAIWKIWISSSVSNSYPVLTVLVWYLFFKEYLTVSQWIFLIPIILGIIFSSFHMKEIKSFSFEKWKTSLFYAFLTMFMWASFASLFDYSVRFFDPVAAAFLVESSVFIWMLWFFTFQGKLQKEEFSYISWKTIKQILELSIVGIIGFILLWYAFQIWSLALVSAIAACSPAVTTLLARIFGKEKLEIVQYIAIWVLVFGISWLSYVSI